MTDILRGTEESYYRDMYEGKPVTFPAYRKEEEQGEYYKLLSKTEMISVRTRKVQSIGITKDLPFNVYVRIYTGSDFCTEEQFNTNLATIKKIIDNQTGLNKSKYG